jgi:serine/threonine protein kinase
LCFVQLGNVLCLTNDPVTVVKICDFGMGRFSASNAMMTFCGTPDHMAPEIINVKKNQRAYTSKVDCWSLGVVLYML